MYIQIKTADCSQNKRVEVSKLTSVKELKSLVEEVLNVKHERQRLFFRGKQLEDDYKVFDYSINVNDVVMLMVKPDLSAFQFNGGSDKNQNESGNKSENKSPGKEKDAAEVKEESVPDQSSLSVNSSKVLSKYFKVGDLVEALYELYGAWFEGNIVDIIQCSSELPETTLEMSLNNESSTTKSKEKVLSTKTHLECTTHQHDGLKYLVSLDFRSDEPPLEFPLASLRPHMNTKLNVRDIKVGDSVLVNYNIESPKERGFWYDMNVTAIPKGETSPELEGTLYVGKKRLTLKNCKVYLTDEVFKIKEPQIMSDQITESVAIKSDKTDGPSKNASTCSVCQDNPERNCKECACHVCGGKNEPNRQIICDECDMAYHLRCLKPPLDTIPDVDEWYCPLCKNDENEIVKAGDKLKESKKKKKLPSSKADTSKRDWGKGMACAGRTKECTIVPPNHFGPIPGVDVGTCWKFRLTASEAGVHRPPVAGIHGRDSEGAYSIVLSGGYEDDVDNGDEFYYTGSGGRDLSGNKRTSEQSSDQTLTRMNLALAVNCNAPVDKAKGAEAKDWRGGKPVRVLRNYKLAKHSKYAPEEGNRYDGIYKVVKYYPEKGESGFIVWRYLLRRDDPAPAPWTEAGMRHIESLGLSMIYPDGYEEMMADKVAASKTEEPSTDSPKSKKRSRKLVLSESATDSPNKKLKVAKYELDEQSTKIIAQDFANEKLWDSCKIALQNGKMKFLSEVQQQFMCICCQELVCDPVTTICHHNICKVCLKRSFSAQVYSCPSCRHDLGKQFELNVNENLSSVLLHFFPGYKAGR